jgi:hypothetical protein
MRRCVPLDQERHNAAFQQAFVGNAKGTTGVERTGRNWGDGAGFDLVKSIFSPLRIPENTPKTKKWFFARRAPTLKENGDGSDD